MTFFVLTQWKYPNEAGLGNQFILLRCIAAYSAVNPRRWQGHEFLYTGTLLQWILVKLMGSLTLGGDCPLQREGPLASTLVRRLDLEKKIIF